MRRAQRRASNGGGSQAHGPRRKDNGQSVICSSSRGGKGKSARGSRTRGGALRGGIHSSGAGVATESRTTNGSSTNKRQGDNNGDGQGKGGTRGRRSQRRAAAHRIQKETTRKIELVDAWGNKEYLRQRGKMNITRHTRVLSVLERRAQRYHNKGMGK